MTYNFFQTPVEFLKGVGPQKADLLKKELNVFTLGDLLYHFPFRYVDRSKFYSTKEINAELPYIQLRGKITNVDTIGEKRKQRLVANFRDADGSVTLVWFQSIKWVKDALKPGVEYVVFGKPTFFNGEINIVHPEIEPVSEENTTLAPALQAVYGSTERLKTRGLDSRGIAKIMKAAFTMASSSLGETLSQNIVNEHHFISYHNALVNIHFPTNENTLRHARARLKFDELFFIQLKLLRLKINRQQQIKGHHFGQIGEYFNRFYKENLPFELTNAQKRVLKEIRLDAGSGKQMNRLIQGDVGSGKTLVALMSMLMALDNDSQACMMAPTEILAAQHYESITKLLDGLDIRVELLTGSSRTKQRRSIHEGLLDGSIHILIGTHALIEDIVQFKNLGLVVIDEQHRFGVEQRSKLWKKNETHPHVLVMTATPIPRTLAMTLYGDLDISVIDELPPGRITIETSHRFDSARLRVFGFMKEQIELGKQAYIVYPLIKESEKMDYKDLMAGYESIARAFPQPQYQISIVHGQMKSKEKDFEMQRFIKGETQIMVATTVIEVGVNVPNASIMIIESAERFGLSQLHQLRGRVGRGADQSYCILMTSYKLGADTKVRIETMVRTNDGFEIADIDMKLRGPGDISGTQQSGVLDLRLADLSKDGAILHLARESAIKLLGEDPQLLLPQNQNIKTYLQSTKRTQTNWSRIS
jgi:ATP-dependent DNA helicase RecG